VTEFKLDDSPFIIILFFGLYFDMKVLSPQIVPPQNWKSSPRKIQLPITGKLSPQSVFLQKLEIQKLKMYKSIFNMYFTLLPRKHKLTPRENSKRQNCPHKVSSHKKWKYKNSKCTNPFLQPTSPSPCENIINRLPTPRETSQGKNYMYIRREVEKKAQE
jgi:hypothetical protein